MAKKQFANLAQLQRYLERGDIINTVFRDKKVLEVLRDEMSKAVHKVVYEQYSPSTYIRREDDGGLSDKRNMHITKVEVVNGKIRILFENLTIGQTRFIPIYEQSVDSLHGQFITDTIIEKRIGNWYDPDATDKKGRVVSDPRDFVGETIRNIKTNPKPLIEAIKGAYKRAGFQIK